MKIDRIVMLVKQERWQEVEISSENGFEMPETYNDLILMCEEIKDDPIKFMSDGDWSCEDGAIIETFDVVGVEV